MGKKIIEKSCRVKEWGDHARLDPDLYFSNTPTLRLWGWACFVYITVPSFGATVRNMPSLAFGIQTSNTVKMGGL